MSLTEAITKVLMSSPEPLHYRQITERLLRSGLWATSGKTPHVTVNGAMSTNKESFVKHGRGMYSLRNAIAPSLMAEDNSKAEPPDAPTSEAYTYLEAAALLLGEEQYKAGLHYRALTAAAIDRKLIRPEGLTPEITMSVQLSADIKKSQSQGDSPRFVRVSRGVFRLAQHTGSSLVNQIDSHNSTIRRNLHKRLQTLDPFEFEHVIGLLLESMGFETVQVTSKNNDNGIDVIGTLVVADVIRTRMAVQVKRWTASIQRPHVQQVRGSLGVHDQGLIITTGKFSTGAQEEANKPNATLVALMDGDTLVNQLIEYGIGIEKSSLTLLALSEDPIAPPQIEPSVQDTTTL